MVGKERRLGGKISRWVIFLNSFKYVVIYRSGKKHQNADTMSRPYVLVLELNDQDDISKISLVDPYENAKLMHFLKTRTLGED